jgi:5-oxopent-3-ene-1,2,5-tricarboxylate decarboxylase/2-hydroxyhepta-2,4-diene-1,7-dioate isomerase
MDLRFSSTPHSDPDQLGLPDWPFAPYRLGRTVVGVTMNDRQQVEAMTAAAGAAPYKGLPQAPVLYVKPRNTWVGAGKIVKMPTGTAAIEVGANVGLVIGRSACRVAEADFSDVVAGCVLVADLSVPHASLYRPSVPLKAWDGSCVFGPAVPLAALGSPNAVDALTLTVRVRGQVVQQVPADGRVRSAARLLADVSDFMTLSPGDVLMLGTACGAPRVGAGDVVEVEAPGWGALRFTVSAGDAA